MEHPGAGGRVSAAVKNSPIKKISFLPVTRGGAQLMSDAKMIYGVWRGRTWPVGGGRAYHKLMNYQGASASTKARRRKQARRRR